MIDLWRSAGVAVHLVPNGQPDIAHLGKALRRGCQIHRYHPQVFTDRIVVSFCNGEFLSRLPEICAAGRPACTVWINCMTWNFPSELAAHAAGQIDLFAFQSDYQRAMVTPALETPRPIRELIGYRPFFSLGNAMQNLSFHVS